MGFAVRIYALVGATDHYISRDDICIYTPIYTGPVRMLSEQADSSGDKQIQFSWVYFHYIPCYVSFLLSCRLPQSSTISVPAMDRMILAKA